MAMDAIMSWRGLKGGKELLQSTLLPAIVIGLCGIVLAYAMISALLPPRRITLEDLQKSLEDETIANVNETQETALYSGLREYLVAGGLLFAVVFAILQRDLTNLAATLLLCMLCIVRTMKVATFGQAPIVLSILSLLATQLPTQNAITSNRPVTNQPMLLFSIILIEIGLPRGKGGESCADEDTRRPLFVQNLMLHAWKPLWKGFRRPVTTDNQAEIPIRSKIANVWHRFRSTRTIKHATLFWRLVWHARSHLIRQQGFSVIKVAATLAGPIFVRAIVLHIANGRQSLNDGMLLVLGLFASNFLASWSDYRARAEGWQIMIEIRALVMAEVFAKILRAADPSDQVGNISLGLTDDAYYISELPVNFSTVVLEAPALIILTTIFLFRILGSAAFVSVAVAVLWLPMQWYSLANLTKATKAGRVYTNARLDRTIEMLGSIKLAKLSTLDKAMAAKITDLRAAEVNKLSARYRAWAFNQTLLFGLPLLMTAGTFLVYALVLGQIPSPAVALPALAVFKAMASPLEGAASWCAKITPATISIRRVHAFLNSEKCHKTEKLTAGASNSAALNKVTSKYSEGSFALEDINAVFLANATSLIIGQTSSGKTTLLRTLLGEMPFVDGQIQLPGDDNGDPQPIAYCSQSPWLLSRTIRENITFGSPFDSARYSAVLEGCALLPDLEQLSHGDGTIVGHRGQILSGGQKGRIGLARALYSYARVLLLDDVLSAVDAQTAKTLAETLKGPLAEHRTIIIVTNAIDLLQDSAASIVTLSNGLLEQSADVKVEDGVAEITSDISTTTDNEKPLGESVTAHAGETLRQGTIDGSVYAQYLRSFGSKLEIAGTLLFAVVIQGLVQYVDVFLKIWASSGDINESKNRLYAAVMTVMVILALFGLYSRCILSGRRCLASATAMHENLLDSVLAAKGRFYDITPLGQIVTRFGADVAQADFGLPFEYMMTSFDLITALSILAVIAWSLPLFTVAAAFFLAFYWALSNLYLSTQRELQRFYRTLRSPLSNLAVETVEGLHTIRAYQSSAVFLADAMRMIDALTRVSTNMNACVQWLIATNGIVTSLAVLASALAVVQSRRISPGTAGLVLVYTSDLTYKLFWTCRHLTQIQSQMTGIERILDYFTLEREKDGTKKLDHSLKPPMLAFDNVSMAYAVDLPLVLREVSFSVKPGERFAICGRTGSGKSSILLALLRYVDIQAGRITLDNCEIRELLLENLRNSVTLVSQDAALLKGSLGYNLDPGTKCLEKQVERLATELGLFNDAHLCDLESEITAGGSNLSAGQKQLINLGRGLLRLTSGQSQILLLDESTANLDSETDTKIQRLLRKHTINKTVICIAHRINTIIDFDRIMVMSEGQVAELDSPKKLLENPDSLFRQLCAQSGGLATLEALVQ